VFANWQLDDDDKTGSVAKTQSDQFVFFFAANLQITFLKTAICDLVKQFFVEVQKYVNSNCRLKNVDIIK
jgi:hypothetical protein